ncbi:MAG: transporter [Hyphomicrobiales bacterium]|nr:transporter [Hyphomicrobiales bacterium]
MIRTARVATRGNIFCDICIDKRSACIAVCAISLHWSVDATAAPGKRSSKNEVKAFNTRMAENEALIRRLQERIQILEGKINPGSSPAILPQAASPSSRSDPQPQVVRQDPSPQKTEAQQKRTRPSVAGAMVVDEAAAQRALERTLTQMGALLLPARVVEVTPILSYSLSERSSSTVGTISLPGSQTPFPAVVSQNTRTNETSVAAAVRVGLPQDFQAEIFVPYSHIRSLRTDDFGHAESARGGGWGDLTIGVAKTFLRERSWRPDLIGRLSYNFGTGRNSSGLLDFQGGYRQLQAQFIALKRQDPIAFTAEISYNKLFREAGSKPGNVAAVSLGAALAASPQTSLQMSYTQVWRGDAERASGTGLGTSQNYGLLVLGASSVLGRDLTAVTQFGIGVGRDAPKYSVSVAFPYLFH